MVYYGPWIQGPDYTQLTHGWAPADLRYLRNSGTDTQYQFIYSGVYDEALAELIDVPSLETANSGTFGSALGISGHGTTRTDPYPWGWGGARDDRGLYTAPSSLTPPSPTTWPPGALFVEWETSASVAVDLSAVIPMVDSGDPGGGGPLVIDYYQRPAVDRFDMSAPAVHTLTVTADNPVGAGHIFNELEISTSNLGPNGGTVIYPVIVDAPGWTWAPPPLDDPEAGSGGRHGYTMAIDFEPDMIPDFTFTLRPPRHRFVFEGAGVAPPCRLYPRDDNLGNSPRIYPPPKTQQRSGRIAGTYY